VSTAVFGNELRQGGGMSTGSNTRKITVQAEKPPETRLRVERKRRGLSIAAVANAIGYEPSNLSRVELGRQIPPRDVARKLHRFYHGRIPLGDIYDPLFRFEARREAWK
jgi:hypothetical protein